MTWNIALPIAAISICVIWLIIGIILMIKNGNSHGIEMEKAVSILIFFILPSLWGLAFSILGLVTNLK